MRDLQKGFIIPSLLILIAVIGVAGGGVYVYENSKVEAPVIDQVVEKTALLTFREFFCNIFGWDTYPYAYFRFTYQEDGEIKHVRTNTSSCDDADIEKASEGVGTLFGEQIKLHYSKGDPVKVTRENGEIYDVFYGEQSNRSYFISGIHIYSNPKYLRNSNPDQVINECLLLKNSSEHDLCLSYQAALQDNIDICSKMIIPSNQDLCMEWINNIRQGSINNK